MSALPQWAGVARAHGFTARVVPCGIEIDIPWSLRLADGTFETGTDTEIATTHGDLRRILGY